MSALTHLALAEENGRLRQENRRVREALGYIVGHEWVADSQRPDKWVREFAEVARRALAGYPGDTQC